MEGEYSIPSQRIITALVPSAPQNLAKLSSTKTSISIEWHVPLSDGGATINLYRVYSNTGSGETYFLTGETTDLIFTHQNLSPSGITMDYKVAAVNDIGESPLTEVVSIILGTVPAMPAAPTL